MLAIIPARYNSRRFPGKVLAPFLGEPLVGVAIKVAIGSRLFSRVVVSSESEQVLQIAMSRGAEIHLRTGEEANYSALMEEHYASVLRQYGDGQSFAVLWPTNPMRTPTLLRHSFYEFMRCQTQCLLSVTRFARHPATALMRDGHVFHSLGELHSDVSIVDNWFWHEGSVLWAVSGPILAGCYIKDLSCTLFEVGDYHAVEINYPMDLAWAEFVVQQGAQYGLVPDDIEK